MDEKNDQTIIKLEQKKEELVDLCAKLLDVEEVLERHKKATDQEAVNLNFADGLLELIEQLNSTIEKLYKIMTETIIGAQIQPDYNKEFLDMLILETDKYIQSVRSGIKFPQRSDNFRKLKTILAKHFKKI